MSLNKIIDKIFTKKRKSLIYQLILLSINEEKMGRVVLGKRGEEIFICYKNEELERFFNDWFGIQKLRRDKQLSNKFYKSFLKSVLKSGDYNKYLEDSPTP